MLHQLLGSGARQVRWGPGRFRRIYHTVNAAQLIVLFQTAVQRLVPQIARHVDAMLEDPVIHIDKIQAAIGSSVQVYRPKALVGRSEKLRPLISVLRFETHAALLETVSPHQVAGRLADETVSIKSIREVVPAVDRRRAGGRERRQRAVRSQLPLTVTAIYAGIDASRPH